MSTMFTKTWEWSSNTSTSSSHVGPRKYHFCPIEHKRMTKEEAEKLGMELLEKVGLADKANANPDSLSGGQNNV